MNTSQKSKISNKAQGLSLNTIIVAALALIVLIVLVAIFTGKIGDFGRTLQTCAGKGGDCEHHGGTSTIICPTGWARIPGSGFLKNDGKNKCELPCCLRVS